MLREERTNVVMSSVKGSEAKPGNAGSFEPFNMQQMSAEIEIRADREAEELFFTVCQTHSSACRHDADVVVADGFL